MIQGLLGEDRAVIAWMHHRYSRVPLEGAAIGVTDDGVLIAGVVYSHLHNVKGKPVNMQMSIVADSPRWALRSIIRLLFEYPFKQVGVERVTAMVAKRNDRSRKLLKGMGFSHEGTMRKAWDGRQAMLIYGMLREECKWIDG